MNKMKRIYFPGLLIALLGLFSIHIFAQEKQKGIQFFEGSWEEVLAAATAADKPIFVDAYAVWCGPCKLMAKRVFTHPDVGDFYNEHFINYKIDAEKGYGREFAMQYGVKAFPTLLYIDKNGDLLHEVLGLRAVRQFIMDGRRGMFDEGQLATMTKAYQQGKRDNDFIKNYMLTLWLAEDHAYETVAEEYFGSLSQAELLRDENLELIFDLADDMKSPLFKILMDNKSAFVKKYDSDMVSTKIIRAAYKYLDKSIATADASLFGEIFDAIKNSGNEKSGEYAARTAMEYYKGTENWKKFTKTAIRMFKKEDIADPNTFNNAAWEFYLNINKKRHLRKAVKWAEKSVALDSQYYNNDTHAALLYKLGKKERALAAAEKAISLAKEKGSDYSETQELLDKIKKM